MNLRNPYVIFAAGALMATVVGSFCRGGPYVETDPEVILAAAPMDRNAPSDTPRYSLQEATRRGFVRVFVGGLDASSGASLRVAIYRLTDYPIDVYVTPGTVFAADSSVQRMVAGGVLGMGADADSNDFVAVTSMYLPTTNIYSYILEAYCLDIELDNPRPASVFVAQSEPNVRAAQIIAQGNREKLPVVGIQAAIWKDQDNHLTQEKVVEKFDPEVVKAVDDGFEMLKRMPWPQKKN